MKEHTEGYPYKMTYSKAHTENGKIKHIEFHHVTHQLPDRPISPEGVKGLVGKTAKHQELKSQGYKPEVIGDHDTQKKTQYTHTVVHTHAKDQGNYEGNGPKTSEQHGNNDD